jgi:methyl-accepting chemotaxis protein
MQAVRSLTGNVALAAGETRAAIALADGLGSVCRQIDKIVEGITLIAVQINMLAVSGAVEAARAGERGRGFAVVSSDIRSLARASSENVERIGTVVRSIQEQVGAVGRGLDECAIAVHVEIGRNQAIMDQLASLASELAAIRIAGADTLASSETIVASVREVLTGTTQIAQAADEMSNATAQATIAAGEQARGSEDLAAAIEEIASLAGELRAPMG